MELLKKEVCEANKALIKHHLVKWASGNVSYRIPHENMVIIKPSGIHFTDLLPEHMVVVDLNGRVVEGNLSPSVDTASHLYVYKHRKDIHSVVHTHSPFATSFAMRGMEIPSYTTTAANVFGEKVPCSSFAAIGEEEIGKQIIENIGDSSAILLRNHGVFTIGESLEKALKSAVILEEIAEYSHYALLHDPYLKPLGSNIIEDCQKFYKTKYGQH